MLQLPNEPETANIEALASITRERLTGVVGTVLTLSQEARAGFEWIVKNGTTVLDPNGGAAGYTISGKTITLGTAATAPDWYLVFYYSRSN
jgi:hypothetical protein